MKYALAAIACLFSAQQTLAQQNTVPPGPPLPPGPKVYGKVEELTSEKSVLEENLTTIMVPSEGESDTKKPSKSEKKGSHHKK